MITPTDRARLDRIRRGHSSHSLEYHSAATDLAHAVSYWDEEGRGEIGAPLVDESLAEWRRARRRLHLAVAIRKIAREREAQDRYNALADASDTKQVSAEMADDNLIGSGA